MVFDSSAGGGRGFSLLTPPLKDQYKRHHPPDVSFLTVVKSIITNEPVLTFQSNLCYKEALGCNGGGN